MEHTQEASTSSGGDSNFQIQSNQQSNVVNQPYATPENYIMYGSNPYIQPVSYPLQPTMNTYSQNPTASYPQSTPITYGNPHQNSIQNPTYGNQPIQKPTQRTMAQKPQKHQAIDEE